jgi:transposase
MQRLTPFSSSDLQALQEVIDEYPHFYLDKIQAIMKRKTGKVWHASTLWRQIHNTGYTLQAAVYKAKQR